MTFCKILKTAVKDGKTITAEEKTDKYSVLPYYQIVIADENGLAIDVIKTAKTTWKKQFNKLTEEV